MTPRVHLPKDCHGDDRKTGLARETSDYERLVLPHLDAAYNLARWLVREPALAEDVVQDAMLSAWRAHAQLRGEAKPWLLRIVRHAAYAALGARQRSGEVDIDAAAAAIDPAPDPETALSHGQDRARLDHALAALPIELRECVVLRELEELSYKEIAAVSGVPIGTVMSRLFRARQALLGAGL